MLEGDGTNTISEDSISVFVNHEMVELPDELQAWRDEYEREQIRKQSLGERYTWNGPSYAIERFVASRRPDDEAPEIFLRLQHADFYTFAAAQQLDRPFADGSTPRTRYLSVPPENAPAFMACAFGVNVSVITSDYKLIASKRSDKVASFPNVWSSSCNEALSRSIDSQGRTPPNIYDVARRGLHEELTLEPNDYDLCLLAFCVVEDVHQWGAVFVARLKELTAREVEDRWTRGGADLWEHSEHRFVPFDAKNVLKFILDPERINQWAPQGPVVHYLALVNEYGRGAVEAEVRRIARSQP